MLRIHIEEQCRRVTIRLEGKLSGPWVTELDRCWQHTLASPSHKSLVVALEAVTYVDVAGEHLLMEMHRSGASLTGKGMWSQHLVKQIRQRAS